MQLRLDQLADATQLRRRQAGAHRLTIRGIGRTIVAEGTYTAPARDPFGTERAALELHATVDRREWDLNWQLPLPDGGDAVGWQVELTAELELVRAA